MAEVHTIKVTEIAEKEQFLQQTEEITVTMVLQYLTFSITMVKV